MKQSEVQRIAQAPERIFLQVGDDVTSADEMKEVEWDGGDVSWCRDQIFDTDIEYVRIDRCKTKR